MSKKKDMLNRILPDCIGIASDLNLVLVDIEFVKDANQSCLRITIDNDSLESVGTDECEAFSRRIEKILDEKDPIKEAYVLEVSSPGLDRPLTKQREFVKYKGCDVVIHLYQAIDGIKEFEGTLVELQNDESIVILCSNKRMEFKKESVSIVKRKITF